MPVKYWKEVVDCATYIRNRVRQKKDDGKTPYEKWYKREPTNDHLRVFGCTAWYKMKGSKPKFEPRGAKGIFMGYAPEAKGYKVWNIKENRMLIARDVVFDETQFPAKDGILNKQGIPSEESPLTLWMRPQIEIEIADDQAPDISQEGNESEDEKTSSGEEQASAEEEVQISETQEMRPRLHSRSGREIKTPLWRKDYCAAANADKSDAKRYVLEGDPQKLEEAYASPNREAWIERIDEEFDNMLRNEVWEFVKKPIDRRVLKTKWTFKTKTDEMGKPVRYKARLVALGNLQKPGIDFNYTYSPVVKARTVRTLMALAVENKWEVHHIDVKAAYLTAELKEEVYVQLPEGLIEYMERGGNMGNLPSLDELRSGRWIIRLCKCMYGLHQSWRAWNETIDAHLISLGLKRCKADPCVYYSEELRIIVTTYVDDLLLFGKRQEVDHMKKLIAAKFEIRDLGKATLVQSMRIKQMPKTIEIDQEMYSRQILTEFGMQECKGASTPLPICMKYDRATDEEILPPDEASRYRTAIGSFMYLVTGTRPDLAFATTYMSQFCSRPSRDHWNGVKHMLRYLKQTVATKLTYTKTEKGIQVYSDADWATDPTDRKSFSGYVILLANGTTSWCSRKQTCIALSTTEAEFIAISEATKECIWQQNLLTEINQGKYGKKPTTVFADNQGAISMAVNHIASERTKHMQLKKFFVQDACDVGIISIRYV